MDFKILTSVQKIFLSTQATVDQFFLRHFQQTPHKQQCLGGPIGTDKLSYAKPNLAFSLEFLILFLPFLMILCDLHTILKLERDLEFLKIHLHNKMKAFRIAHSDIKKLRHLKTVRLC